MITITSRGDFRKANSYLEKLREVVRMGTLNKYGRVGVEALSAATPRDTGETAKSWSYKISHDDRGAVITWYNDHVNDGVNIALILQYGHGTGTGGFVEGIDYVNPAMTPVFDEIADKAWKEVTSL